MSQIDLFKTDRAYYKAGAAPVLVNLSSIPFLTVAGDSPIEGEDFWQKWSDLQKMGFAIRNVCREEDLDDFVLPRLEGLYPSAEQKDKNGSWRLMMRLPNYIDTSIFEKARKNLAKADKKAASTKIRFQELEEGKVVQVMHVGPRDQAGDTLDRLKRFTESQHYDTKGPRHEIYISDPQRVEPERNKTIFRYQVEKQPGN